MTTIGPVVLSPKIPESGVIREGSFVGRGAVDVFRALTPASALRLWARTKIIPTRGVGIMAMLRMVREYAGHRYPRTAAMRAADAVEAWARDAAGGMQGCERD